MTEEVVESAIRQLRAMDLNQVFTKRETKMTETQQELTETQKWDKATQSEFLTIGEDEQKELVVSYRDLVPVTKEYDGLPKLIWVLRMKVHSINGSSSETNKWEVSNRKLIEKLRPLLENNTEKVSVRVVRTGKGKATSYSVAKIQ